jgi:hypothetical protein
LDLRAFRRLHVLADTRRVLVVPLFPTVILSTHPLCPSLSHPANPQVPDSISNTPPSHCFSHFLHQRCRGDANCMWSDMKICIRIQVLRLARRKQSCRIVASQGILLSTFWSQSLPVRKLLHRKRVARTQRTRMLHNPLDRTPYPCNRLRDGESASP